MPAAVYHFMTSIHYSNEIKVSNELVIEVVNLYINENVLLVEVFCCSLYYLIGEPFLFIMFFASFTETGSLTIVRRSNSRKGNLLQQSDHHTSDHQYDTEATIENFQYTGDFDNMQSSSLQTVTKQDDVVTSDNVDLASDNLPAVDTPDACDKAALR